MDQETREYLDKRIPYIFNNQKNERGQRQAFGRNCRSKQARIEWLDDHPEYILEDRRIVLNIRGRDE